MTSRSANLLGALSTSLSDRLNSAVEAELGVGGIASSALVVIGAEKGITIEKLAKALKLAQSSMVRAVQQLVDCGFIEKRTGRDRRMLPLYLTSLGRQKLRRILKYRADVLEKAISAISSPLRNAFSDAMEAVLEDMVKLPDDRFAICRLCDENSCGEYEDCPVERGTRKTQQLQNQSQRNP